MCRQCRALGNWEDEFQVPLGGTTPDAWSVRRSIGSDEAGDPGFVELCSDVRQEA